MTLLILPYLRRCSAAVLYISWGDFTGASVTPSGPASDKYPTSDASGLGRFRRNSVSAPAEALKDRLHGGVGQRVPVTVVPIKVVSWHVPFVFRPAWGSPALEKPHAMEISGGELLVIYWTYDVTGALRVGKFQVLFVEEVPIACEIFEFKFARINVIRIEH